MTDKEERQLCLDYLIRLAKDPMGVLGEAHEALLDVVAQRDLYHAALARIAQEDPIGHLGWIASQTLRGEPCPPAKKTEKPG